MDLCFIWLFTRKKSLPRKQAFLEPIPFSESAIIQTLIRVGKELIASFYAKKVQFQRTNFRYLIWKVEILVLLFEYMYDMESCTLPPSCSLCCRELSYLFFHSKVLLDYCSGSSKMWMLILNERISHQLHGICKEILMVLDVFPIQEIDLCEEVGELVEVLKQQLARKSVFTDPQDEALRRRLLSFVEEFGAGRIPVYEELQAFYVDKMGIKDAKTFKSELQFLGDLFRSHENEVECFSSIVIGVLAVMQYCRMLFFGFEEGAEYYNVGIKELHDDLVSQLTEETFSSIERELSCPISLELMSDPVIVSTGQTYDRSSISKWMKKGKICPKTKQPLTNNLLVPNTALRSLIHKWCIACGRHFGNDPMEILFAVSPTMAVIEANKATVGGLIKLLPSESIRVNMFAAHELLLLIKKSGGKNMLAYIAEAGGSLCLLQKLLLSSHPVAEWQSMKEIFHLSRHENNKPLIMEQLAVSIVHVLRNGGVDEVRNDAASALLSLCTIHEYKERIAGIEGAIDALLWLLKRGGRAKISAAKTLVLLADHENICRKLIEAGCHKYLAEALDDAELSEHASAAFLSLVRHPFGAQALREDRRSITALRTVGFWSTGVVGVYATAALQELFPDLVIPLRIVVNANAPKLFW